MEKQLITLEPELQAIADQWSPEMCLIMARKMRRWVPQLKLRGYTMIAARNRGPWKRKHLKRVTAQVAQTN